MKYYTSTTESNCRIDLHARQRYVCLMDRQGQKLVHTNIQHNDFNFFLKRVAPCRHDLTVCCECLFGWSWLADACQAAGLTLVAVRKDPTRSTSGPSTAAKRKTTASTPRLSDGAEATGVPMTGPTVSLSGGGQKPGRRPRTLAEWAAEWVRKFTACRQRRFGAATDAGPEQVAAFLRFIAVCWNAPEWQQAQVRQALEEQQACFHREISCSPPRSVLTFLRARLPCRRGQFSLFCAHNPQKVLV